MKNLPYTLLDKYLESSHRFFFLSDLKMFKIVYSQVIESSFEQFWVIVRNKDFIKIELGLR